MSGKAQEVVVQLARGEHVPAIAALINRFAAQDLMLPRSEEQIRRALPDFLVALEPSPDGGGRVVACGSLAALSPDLAEIRSLAVDESQQGKGLGGVLASRLVDMAYQRGFKQVCALTLRSNFFERRGFEVVDRWSISPKLWQECIYCPKFHRCDEIAVLMNLEPAPEDSTHGRAPGWNGLLKWSEWAPLKLAFQAGRSDEAEDKK